MSYSNSPANIVILIPKWALHLNSCLPGLHLELAAAAQPAAVQAWQAAVEMQGPLWNQYDNVGWAI